MPKNGKERAVLVTTARDVLKQRYSVEVKQR